MTHFRREAIALYAGVMATAKKTAKKTVKKAVKKAPKKAAKKSAAPAKSTAPLGPYTPVVAQETGSLFRASLELSMAKSFQVELLSKLRKPWST